MKIRLGDYATPSPWICSRCHDNCGYLDDLAYENGDYLPDNSLCCVCKELDWDDACCDCKSEIKH